MTPVKEPLKVMSQPMEADMFMLEPQPNLNSAVAQIVVESSLFARQPVLRRNREWAGAENEKCPKTGSPGLRPSPPFPNPRQHGGERTKKNQPRAVGFKNSGGEKFTTELRAIAAIE